MGRSDPPRASRAPHRARGRRRSTASRGGLYTEGDLGTEGAGYADVGLRDAIRQGVVPGPRILAATRAIVARGAYGPKRFEAGVVVPQGAEEASGIDGIVAAVRGQIAAGADVVKLYGDYRWGLGEPSRPTFSQTEMNAAVAAAHDAGRTVAVHSVTAEGMRRAVAAGADTIEHGYGGTPEIFRAMHDRGVAYRKRTATHLLGTTICSYSRRIDRDLSDEMLRSGRQSATRTAGRGSPPYLSSFGEQ